MFHHHHHHHHHFSFLSFCSFVIFFAIAAPPTIGTITHIVFVFLFARRGLCYMTRCEENDFYVIVVVVMKTLALRKNFAPTF